MSLNLHQFNTAQAAAHALATAIADDVRHMLGRQERALLLLSGGRSPLAFFPVLAGQDLPWERIDVSLVDERCVPFEHADSNAGLIARHLLQGPAAMARLLPLMAPPRQGEDTWQWAQRSAAAASADPALAAPAVVVLGLGNDGHTASLFIDAPQWKEAISTSHRYVAVAPAHAPHARVSLSLSALVAQRRCYAWTGGAAKLDIIRHAQSLAADIRDGVAEEAALHEAGPFALLIGNAEMTLQVFHCNRE